MKVCLVAPVSRWRGGIHQYSAQLANSLVNAAEVAVISYKNIFPRWFYPGESTRTGCEIGVSRAIKVYEILKYYSIPSSFVAARIITKRIRPDVVDIQWFVPQHGLILIPLIVFLRYLFRSQAKVFLTVHNVQPHESRLFDRWLSRAAFQLSDRLLVHAEKLRDEVVEHFDQPHGKVTVIPHGICVDTNAVYGKAESRTKLGIKEKYVILFFGYVRPYKGLSDLIDAFKIVSGKSDVALVIAGQFFTPAALYREQLRNMGLLEKAYIFSQYIESDEVPVFFKAADMLIQPYIKFSGQSGVTQTAYLHSLPIVATDVGGLPELVMHGETGLIVRRQNPRELAAAIAALLGDENKRLCYGRNGKKLLDANLTWDRIMHTMLTAYGE